MLICKLPEGIRKVADCYKALYACEGIGFANTTALFTYFLFGCTGLSELARTHVNSPSVSELSRAVQNFPGSRFMRRYRQSILRKYGEGLNPDDFVIAIDDTDNPKYGKKIYGCGSWVAKHSGYYGQKILLLALVDMKRQIAIPLNYAFLFNKDRPEHEPALGKVIQLLDECLSEGLPNMTVVADSWFDSAELRLDCLNRGITLVTEIKSNRLARNGTGRNVRYKKLPEIFSSPKGEVYARPLKIKRGRGRPTLRFTESAVLQLRTMKTPVKIVAVFNKRTSKKPFAYFASTDRTMPGATVWKIFRARWCIEVLFRDLKQNLSFGQVSCVGKNAADLAVCLPFILIASLRLDPDIWNMQENKTIGHMVTQTRNRILDVSIVALSRDTARDLRNRVATRRCPERHGRKPVDQAAA